MKTIILTIMALFMTTGLFASSEVVNNKRLCKIFTQKTIDYKKTMRSDFYAQKTLESYKNRSKLFCSK